ncbi:MAG: coiled-coil domain-containing protein, partial [Thermoplasmata archaeon]
ETYNEQEKEVINIIRDKKKEIENLEQTIASLNQKMEQVKKADANVNSELFSDMQLKAALDDKITELKAKISVLETKDSNYVTMIDSRNQKIKDLDREIIKISGIQSSVYDRNKVLDQINADISKANNDLNQVQNQQRNIMQSINDTQEKILTANMVFELIKSGTINLSSMNQLTKILGLKSFTNAAECRQYLIDQIIKNFSNELGPYISGYRLITRTEYQQYLNAKQELNALVDNYANGSLTQNISLKSVIDGILEQKYEHSILQLNSMVKDQTAYSVNDTVKSVSGNLLNSYKMLKTGMGYKDTGAIDYETMCPFCKKTTHVNINVTELYEKDTVNVTCESGHNFNIPTYEVLKGLIFPGANMVLANSRIFHTITIIPHFKANDTKMKPQ